MNTETDWTPFVPEVTHHGDSFGRIRFVQPPTLQPLKDKYVTQLLVSSRSDTRPLERTLKSIAMSAFLSDWPMAHVERLFAESPAFGPVVQQQGTEWLQPLLRAARAHATPQQVDVHVEYLLADLKAARSALQSIRWPRVPGIPVSDGAATMVLHAILAVSERAKTTTDLHLSVRCIGLESGTNKSIASRAIRLLEHHGVLSRFPKRPKAPRGHSRGYDLNIAAITNMASKDTVSLDPVLANLFGHDAFRRGALSPSGFRILSALDPDIPNPVARIAQQVGLTTGWTKTKLQQLALYRLAVHRDGMWIRCTSDALRDRLHEAATHSGKAGESERLSSIYENERDHFLYRKVSLTKKVNRDTGEVEVIL